jgi:hypothetical protein
MAIDWTLLVDVRDRHRQQAEEAVAHERSVVQAHEAHERDAERQWQRQLQLKQQHLDATRQAVSAGGCSVADLRDASDGARALDLDIAREARALVQAQAALMRQREVLAASLQRLREASAGLDKAQRMHQEARARCARLKLLRTEDVVEEAALRVWNQRQQRHDG